MKHKRWIGLVAVVLLGTLPASAQRLVPFQAVLNDDNGTPLNGVFNVGFGVYDASVGGTLLWAENHPAASVIDGRLNVLLGSMTSFDDPNDDGNSSDAVSFSDPKYLGITVGTLGVDTEMLPRHQLVPAFHAVSADLALSVAPGAVTSTVILDNSITSADIQNNTITGDDILDNSITSADVQNNTITGDDILDSTITSFDIQNNSITGTDIQNSSITSSEILDGTITSADIQNGTITGNDIQNNAISSVQILTNAVGAQEIAGDAVGSSEIAPNAVRESEIADGAVQGSELGFGWFQYSVLAPSSEVTTPDRYLVCALTTVWFGSGGRCVAYSGTSASSTPRFWTLTRGAPAQSCSMVCFGREGE